MIVPNVLGRLCKGFGWGFPKSFYYVNSEDKGGECEWHCHRLCQRELGAELGEVFGHIVALDANV